jgi:hypothetical protein
MADNSHKTDSSQGVTSTLTRKGTFGKCLCMSEIAEHEIKTLPSYQAETNVPPTEPLFTLTASQLREIINQAVAEATLDLKAEVDQLRASIDQQNEIKAKIEDMEKDMDSLANNDIAQLRLIADLRKKEPGKTELSRTDKIEKYLQARPDHKATFETLKGHLGIDNDLLGITIRYLLTSGKYAIIKTPGDKRKRTLVMLPK